MGVDAGIGMEKNTGNNGSSTLARNEKSLQVRERIDKLDNIMVKNGGGTGVDINCASADDVKNLDEKNYCDITVVTNTIINSSEKTTSLLLTSGEFSDNKVPSQKSPNKVPSSPKIFRREIFTKDSSHDTEKTCQNNFQGGRARTLLQLKGEGSWYARAVAAPPPRKFQTRNQQRAACARLAKPRLPQQQSSGCQENNNDLQVKYDDGTTAINNEISTTEKTNTDASPQPTAAENTTASPQRRPIPRPTAGSQQQATMQRLAQLSPEKQRRLLLEKKKTASIGEKGETISSAIGEENGKSRAAVEKPLQIPYLGKSKARQRAFQSLLSAEEVFSIVSILMFVHNVLCTNLELSYMHNNG